ncbi:MAG: sulfatase-like hydrolase/transferase, partial [Candidatus Poribacteria bacterium]
MVGPTNHTDTEDGSRRTRDVAHTNILLLYVDQMRYDAMGCAGNPVIRTPALDQLAAEGANFTRAV